MPGQDIREIRAVARQFGVTGELFDAFSEHVHALKRQGHGGSKNQRGDFTVAELRECIRQFLEERGFHG